MKFIEDKIKQRWVSGAYVITQYPAGFFTFQYFRYTSGGGRDSKILHKRDEPSQSLEAAKALIEKHASQPTPKGIILVNAPL